MNSTLFLYSVYESYSDAFAKCFTFVLLGVIIISVNGMFVFTYFKSSVFYTDPRYILYIHLVINDMLMVFFSGALSVMGYTWQNVPLPFCLLVILISSVAHKNTPLTLAGMAVERYIAVCKPLHHHQICTVRRTYILISLIWGVGMIPALADLILLSILRPLSVSSTASSCGAQIVYNSPYHEIENRAMYGIYTSGVWLILIFTYCQVMIAARRASSDQSSVKKAQSTILLHGVQLLLCMLSYIAALIQKIPVPLSPFDRAILNYLSFLLTNLIPRLLTPLIYGVRDKQFYKHMKVLFSCRLINAKVHSIKH